MPIKTCVVQFTLAKRLIDVGLKLESNRHPSIWNPSNCYSLKIALKIKYSALTSSYILIKTMSKEVVTNDVIDPS